MKALVIAPQPFFSPRGTPFSVYYRTMITAQLGVEIDLLTYGEGQDVDIPGVRIHRIPQFAFLGPIKVGPSMLKLFLDVFIVLWTLVLLARKRYDFVHAHEESVFFCRYLKPLFRFRLIYDMHSSLPQQLTNFKFTTSGLLIGLFEKLENSCLAHSDAVITICPELADYAIPRVPDAKRHFLIENSIFDPVQLKGSPNRSNEDSSELAIPADRPIVAYAGTFEPYQGLEVLIRAFARVRESRPDAFLMLIGGSPGQVQHYAKVVQEQGLDGHCVCEGRMDQTRVKRYLARAAVLTSPRVEGTNTPLKVYEQLASGIPLVATRILSHTQVLDDSVCFLVEPTAESMSSGILEALEDDEARARRVSAAQELYDSKYSRRAYEAKMRDLLAVLR